MGMCESGAWQKGGNRHAIATRKEALRASLAPGEGDCPARRSRPVPLGGAWCCARRKSCKLTLAWGYERGSSPFLFMYDDDRVIRYTGAGVDADDVEDAQATE
ncbi:hypothetical protein DEO72_LG4g572 [Vigna unguiculata]|uniref:Uncharacterized protein n=1 Tax=Vigna unguiculata TaxID=3917 RepID=A0A4D6LN14_VIGUN|nr:hypothetical protein DEO72_LG4g572 [Vigna unguiculata]